LAIVWDGEDGISPAATFKSTVFKRTNGDIDTPEGGDYSAPWPYPANG
jgi:hypothetical protein